MAAAVADDASPGGISSYLKNAIAILSERATPLLLFGFIAAGLAQLGLYFSVELNTKAPLGYLLLLTTGVAAFALGSDGAVAAPAGQYKRL